MRLTKVQMVSIIINDKGDKTPGNKFPPNSDDNTSLVLYIFVATKISV